MAVIDLSQLPAPQIVDVPDFETLLAERKAEFVALHPKDEQEAVMRTLELESERPASTPRPSSQPRINSPRKSGNLFVG